MAPVSLFFLNHTVNYNCYYRNQKYELQSLQSFPFSLLFISSYSHLFFSSLFPSLFPSSSNHSLFSSSHCWSNFSTSGSTSGSSSVANFISSSTDLNLVSPMPHYMAPLPSDNFGSTWDLRFLLISCEERILKHVHQIVIWCSHLNYSALQCH